MLYVSWIDILVNIVYLIVYDELIKVVYNNMYEGKSCY